MDCETLGEAVGLGVDDGVADGVGIGALGLGVADGAGIGVLGLRVADGAGIAALGLGVGDEDEAEIGVVRLIGDAHGPTAKFPKAAILSLEKLILMVALHCGHERRQNRLKPSS